MALFSSTSHARVAASATPPLSLTRLIVATSLGNGLEIFDFTIYSFFAVLIGRVFFPAHTELGSLLLAVATFGAGFVVRPLGGVVLGGYADRVGRRAAMKLTILLMALGTAMIGLTPGYASIGPLAPLLVVAGRLLQGFSAGGEIGASTTLLMEASHDEARGFMVSWQSASQGGAALAGALCGYALSHALPHAALLAWGWRLPFLLGLAIAPVGLYIRNRLPETHQPREAPSRAAFLELLAHYPGTLALGTLIFAGRTALMYLFVFYLPTYLIGILHMPPRVAFPAGCISGLTLLVVSPFAGRLTDRLAARKPLVIWTTLIGTLLIYPAFALLGHTASLGLALAVVAAFVACFTLSAPASFLLVSEAFPRAVRSSGLAVIYSVGVSIFGGFAQFIVTWLIHVSGNPLSPVWYASAGSVMTLLALWGFKARRVE